jgi:hypothetical protein
MDKLLGDWQADLDRWGELNEEVAKLGPMFEQIVGKLTASITEDTLTIEGFKREGPRVFTYRVTEEEGSALRLEVEKEGGGDAVYGIEIVDDDHFVLRMLEPRPDVMAFKR